jgi:hypothetical protein
VFGVAQFTGQFPAISFSGLAFSGSNSSETAPLPSRADALGQLTA